MATVNNRKLKLQLKRLYKCNVSLVGLIIISLACVSSETHNLQCVSPPPGGGVVPYIDYMGMCGAKGYVFSSRFGLK